MAHFRHFWLHEQKDRHKSRLPLLGLLSKPKFNFYQTCEILVLQQIKIYPIMKEKKIQEKAPMILQTQPRKTQRDRPRFPPL